MESGDSLTGDVADRAAAAVDLYWLPLGAGGHFVRLNGRLYEALTARVQRRPAYNLYHSALQVEVPDGTFVIEQAPVHDWSGAGRGVVAEGPVGARWAGRCRIFRYEIRLWPGGHIPDVAEAVNSPQRLSDDDHIARRVLEATGRVPTPVWGRDELHTGRDVELELRDRVDARAQRDRHRVNPAPGRRTGARLARRTRGCAHARHSGAKHRREFVPALSQSIGG
jgi:hypothetical protein